MCSLPLYSEYYLKLSMFPFGATDINLNDYAKIFRFMRRLLKLCVVLGLGLRDTERGKVLSQMVTRTVVR